MDSSATFTNGVGGTFTNTLTMNITASSSGYAIFYNDGTYTDAATGTGTTLEIGYFNPESSPNCWNNARFVNTGTVTIESGDTFVNQGMYQDNAGVNSTDSNYFYGTTINAGGTFITEDAGANPTGYGGSATSGLVISTWDIFTNYGTYIDNASLCTSVESGYSTIGLSVTPNSDFYNYGTVTVMSGDTLEIEGYYYDNNNNAGDNYIGTTVESGGTLTINGGNNGDGGTFFINDDVYVYGTVNNLYTNNVQYTYTNGVILTDGGTWNGYYPSTYTGSD